MTAIRELFEQATQLWLAGGWCMAPIALVGAVMFGLGTHMYLRLREKGFEDLPEERWRRWVKVAEAREGRVGELLDVVTGSASLAHLAAAFAEVRATEVAPFRRELRLMKVCINTAPLLGLLGTVTGMLATFHALGTGSGGEQTMALVAQGISEALITTETGLVVALPGVFFQHVLVRKHERYEAFLARLETVCAQRLHRALHARPKQAS